MLKKIVVWFLSFIVLFCTVIIPDFSSFATIITPVDDSSHYYFGNNLDFNNWESTDILTQTNYNNLTTLTGDLTDYTINTFYAQFGNYTDERLYNTLTADYSITDSGYYDIHNTWFKPIVVNGETIPIEDCKKVCGIDHSGFLYNILLYSPTGNNIAFGTGYRRGFFSDNLFYMSSQKFNIAMANDGDLTFFKFSDNNENGQIQSSQQNSQGFPTDSQVCRADYLGNIFYADCIILFQAFENNPTYGENSTYRYDLIANYGGAWLNESDTTGFVVDRRTSNYLDKTSGSNSNDIISQGYDPMLFEGSLGFKSFISNASLNYNKTTDKYEPYFDINYVPNNYTKIHIDDISIIYQAELSLKLTFADSSRDMYHMSTRYKTSGNASLDRSNSSPNADKYDFKLYAMTVPPSGNPTFTNVSTRNTAGLSSQFGVSPFNGSDITSDVTIGIKAYKNNSSVVVDSEAETLEMIRDYFNGKQGQSTNNSYGLFNISVYIKNNVTGDVSQTYSASFDLFNNKTGNNGANMINDDDQAFNDFVNQFNYVDDNGEIRPVDYADHINVDGGDNNNVINIQNPQYPYVLVDIPENEWLDKTPNLKNMLNDFKTMLAETNDGSILTMLPATYSYLPAPVWNYILYGVGICVMIGIWHAITRR